jgi:hypothetical protein
MMRVNDGTYTAGRNPLDRPWPLSVGKSHRPDDGVGCRRIDDEVHIRLVDTFEPTKSRA